MHCGFKSEFNKRNYCDDGGSRFLLNSCKFLSDYMALQHRLWPSTVQKCNLNILIHIVASKITVVSPLFGKRCGHVNTLVQFRSLLKSTGSMSWRPGDELAACDFHTPTWHQPWDAFIICIPCHIKMAKFSFHIQFTLFSVSLVYGFILTSNYISHVFYPMLKTTGWQAHISCM
jgi:hypothetical protein